jgi:hypothetical protein
MPYGRRLLCITYGTIALLALIATWSQNLSYFRPEEGLLVGFVMATGRFWPETLATPASVSITVDLGLFLLAAAVFMVIESRRLDIRFPWLYVVFGLLVAISVTFPLFLIARERRLDAREQASLAPTLSRGDRIGLVGLGGALAAFSLWTVGR